MRKWTRERILREIIRREAAGQPLALTGEQGVGFALYQAADRIFGSWRNAVVAAGVAPRRARVKHAWPPSRILKVIRSLARRRTPLSAADLKNRYGYLMPVARRHFGSWSKAVVAAGVDPLKLRPARTWTRERQIEAILTRALNGEPLGCRTVRPRSLAEAACRVFGAWSTALEAAGLDPAVYSDKRNAPQSTVRPPSDARSRDPSDADLLNAVAQRARDGRAMTAAAVRKDDRRTYSAAIRRFGTWSGAKQAAGLVTDGPDVVGR